MESEKTQYQFLDFRSQGLQTDMWLGSSRVLEYLTYVCDNGKIISKVINCSPALLKSVDEVLVNAFDQYILQNKNTRAEGGPITKIDVEFDMDTKYITITNNGKGMSIDLTDNGKYTVERLITNPYSGSNFKKNIDDAPDPDKVTGGMHGVGLKATAIYSTDFNIETVYLPTKLKYSQQFIDNVHPNKIKEPIIKEKYNGPSYTKIRWRPDYEKLCKGPGTWEYDTDNIQNFYKWLEYRLCIGNVFLNSIKYRYSDNKRIEYTNGVTITLNGKNIKPKSTESLANMFKMEDVYTFSIESDDNKIRFPWYITFGITDKFTHITSLNGIVMTSNHTTIFVNVLKNKLYDKLSANYKKNITESIFSNVLKKLLFIIDVKQIPVMSFGSQSKEKFDFTRSDLNKLGALLNKQIPDDIINSFWNKNKAIIEHFLDYKEASQLKAKIKGIKVRKYEPAKDAGGPNRANTLLFVPEGDSAEGTIKKAINNTKTGLNRDLYGRYNIQGVPPNALKHIKEIKIGNKTILKQSAKFTENKSLQGLYKVLGLNYDYKYRIQTEISTLRYGGIVCATDQDLDGIGHICSLILVYFLTFWPALVRSGYVKRLATPIIRSFNARNKKEFINFYNQKDFNSWAIREFGNIYEIPKSFRIEYYKGLGSHEDHDIENDIGKNLHKNIFTFGIDKKSKELLYLTYGKDTDGRKKILCSPVTWNYSEDYMETQKITCSEHFMIESKSMQLERIIRSLASAIDGLTPTKRKIISGARIKLSKQRGIKVYQLGGFLTEKFNYHHGDKSINDTIIKLAQKHIGTNNVPLLIPLAAGFGDRSEPRDKSSSPRYISVGYNKKVTDKLFPSEDKWLLPFVFDEGKQCEPEYFVPILPYAIMETYTVPAVGWKQESYARTLDSVIDNVKHKILYGVQKYPFDGHVWVSKNMKIVTSTTPNGKTPYELCIGNYKRYSDRIIINEVPLKTWSCNVKKHLLNIKDKNNSPKAEENTSKFHVSEVIKSVYDRSQGNIIEIEVNLQPDAIDKICEQYPSTEHLDSIEIAFRIYESFQPHLNFVTKEGYVHEFKNYSEILDYWFEIRKLFYLKRIERQLVILELRILYTENIIRFLEAERNKIININKKSEAEADMILEEHKFIKFNHVNLLQPRYIPVDELRNEILVKNVSYDYIGRITTRERCNENYVKLSKQLDEHKNELKRYKNIKWQELWISEIDDLVDAINDGIANNWEFD